MSFDYKKEYKEFYLPPKKPVIIDIPKMAIIKLTVIFPMSFRPLKAFGGRITLM